MHILQTVSSTDILFSGVTYCVNELSQGLSILGQNVEILSLSSTQKAGLVQKMNLNLETIF